MIMMMIVKQTSWINCLLIDSLRPFDSRMAKGENIFKYNFLTFEIERIWSMKAAMIVQVIIGTLGTVSSDIDKWLKEIGIECFVEILHKICLIGTGKII